MSNLDHIGPLPSEVIGVMAGPCSAESREQTLETALRLAQTGVRTFRAGLWKPRTHPGGFEGVGAEGLPWLSEVRERTGMRVATEVATPEHVAQCVQAGVDILWIGARTTANPFAVQAIADALTAVEHKPIVLVKNPVSPDLELWIGALQRLADAGVTRLGAVLRGFSAYGEQVYRNRPHWSIAFELKRRFPGLSVVCDPSHIAGRRGLVEDVARKAVTLRFDGLMIEVHTDPDKALSDSAQQLTPDQIAALLSDIATTEKSDSPANDTTLEDLREQIDRLDESLVEILARRMELAERIGTYKHERGISVVQPSRYQDMMRLRVDLGEQRGLSPDFMRRIFTGIHEESVRRQLDTDK
ncbi:MAG: bifunctional 3-deoxy-7-phosphoheptulonate synthase/chorismate mutase type II [Muribaculaceae bacterium]|nr:bifunctional 3-deoxy-7-phosphoheptulonate synthase/chorismate mutase type II [Muribaculaceae bacterium]